MYLRMGCRIGGACIWWGGAWLLGNAMFSTGVGRPILPCVVVCASFQAIGTGVLSCCRCCWHAVVATVNMMGGVGLFAGDWCVPHFPGLCLSVYVVASWAGVDADNCRVFQQFGTCIASWEGEDRACGACLLWQFSMCCTHAEHYVPSTSFLHCVAIVLWVCQAGSIPRPGIRVPM